MPFYRVLSWYSVSMVILFIGITKLCKIGQKCVNFSYRFSDEHGFVKPNDLRALELMDHAAKTLMQEYKDISLALGESDEYRYVIRISFLLPFLIFGSIPNSQGSFLLRKSTALYNRRQSKIVSTLTSLFTSSYVFHWPKYFPDVPLRYPPSFDGRIVLYPSQQEVRDYFAWRQADSTQVSLPVYSPVNQCPLSTHQQSLQYSVLGSRATRWSDDDRGACDT